MPIKIHLSKNNLLPLFIISTALLVSAVVFAVSEEDIVFPVAELENCQNEQECKSYCDLPENVETCLTFAKKHNLLSQAEIDKAEKFLAIGTGPGGCTSHFECENYCNDINNIDECLAFAEQYGMMQDQELQEAKQIQRALAQGAKMPGGCRNRDECENYCSNPNNMAECLSFAKAAGFMSSEELKEAEKFLVAIQKGAKPPACRGKEECQVYCSAPENFEECLAFAEAAGFIAPEQAELARKTGGKGPGGCKGEQECRAFCENPANQEECFNFATEHGLISEEDKLRMQEGMAQMQEGLEMAPPEVRECFERELGPEKIAEIRTGTAVVGPHMGDIMRECFEQLMPAPGEFGPPPGEGGSFPPEGFSPPEGAIPGGFTGPGGCTNPEECQQYCSDPAHWQECGGFAPPQQQEEPTGFLRDFIKKAAAFLLSPLTNLLK